MTINKYQGRTKEEAIEKAKQEMGQAAVVLNVKEIKPKGMFKAFKESVYEVTAAIEEAGRARTSSLQGAASQPGAATQRLESINLAADEAIQIPSLKESPQPSRPTAQPRVASQPKAASQPGAAMQQGASQAAVASRAASAQASAAAQTAAAQPVAASRAASSQMSASAQAAASRVGESRVAAEEPQQRTSQELEKRLESLSHILERQLSGEPAPAAAEERPKVQEANPEGFQFIKMLYRTMLENDVNEKYVNQIMDEAEKVMNNGSSVDVILSNVYQKLILKFGQPDTISLTGKKPRIIFFIGPTGVGKTTTLAKIASRYKVEKEKRVAFLTADTYRIAATEQLRIYANILDAPMSIIYTAEEMNASIGKMSDYDLIFVDTAGFSHRNEEQCGDMKRLIGGLSEQYEKEVYLVLSATTKYRDLLEIADIYKEIADYKLIFTKLDETTTYGNILNIKLYSEASLSYMTNGQNVPDDIEEFDTQKIVKQLLGGR